MAAANLNRVTHGFPLLALWSDDVQGRPLNNGHFFPEDAPGMLYA